MLNLPIVGGYLEFIKKFGTVSFNGEEIYGITNDNFINNAIPNGIWLTLNERINLNLPNDLLIIAEDYFGRDMCV